MAPITLASANLQYDRSITKLLRASIKLDKQLPPCTEEDLDSTEVPSLRPQHAQENRPRGNSVANCPRCAAELEIMEPGAREGHVCTHQDEHVDDEVVSRVGSEAAHTRGTTRRRGSRQPRLSVIKQYMDELETEVDVYTDSVSNLCSVLPTHEEKEDYRNLLLDWIDYVEVLKDRARDAIEVLEAAKDAVVDEHQQANTGNNATASTGDGVSNGNTGTPTSSQPLATPTSSGTPVVAQPSGTNTTSTSGSTGTTITPTTGNTGQIVNSGGSTPSTDTAPFVSGVVDNNAPGNMEIQIALRKMNSIGHAIHQDIVAMESESSGTNLNDQGIADIRQFCESLKADVEGKYTDAGNAVVRLDVDCTTNAVQVLDDNIQDYQGRLRTVLANLRRARSVGMGSGASSLTADIAGGGSVQPAKQAQGYKPFLERLKPPTFSGKVEDWPEFRSVWKDLLSDYPESVQVQHLKSNIPAADAKRVVGVKTMEEMWKRLEKVYGDKDLNIITVKTNLENFTSKATKDHKKILEVYEAIESAVTQLQNLDALHYLKDDFGLMNQLIMKLPAADQRQYTQYVASESFRTDPSSRWDKFWSWMGILHSSAVQANLMQMCDRSSNGKPSNEGLNSGITCNNCGGIGHYSKNCSSKPKSQGPTAAIKVNMAAAKITTESEYNQYLPETKKQVGKCPACNQAAHTYTRQFPFGKAEWPSIRLESCPQYSAMSSRERGELLEKVKGCYKCTSWKHQGDDCFTRGKSCCPVVEGGVACSGAHHKSLHGSGVAFCHKISVKVDKIHVVDSDDISDDTNKPPGISQPVLLEVQSFKVHEVTAKVFFDNGSSAALVTHSFAQQAGLNGDTVTYWLVVVGHEKVLRQTTLYKMFLEDNTGKKHEVLAYGIDQISEDSQVVDLHGVKTVFPGAPREVFNRPSGPIDILIGSAYKNLQPYGGEGSFTKGRLRLVRSLFGCGFILTGTHPSISATENSVTDHAKHISNCILLSTKEVPKIPTVSCNRATVALEIQEVLADEELGIAPVCKCCPGSTNCRNTIISMDKELDVKLDEELIQQLPISNNVTASLPWTEDICKISDGFGQTISSMETYNAGLRKIMQDYRQCTDPCGTIPTLFDLAEFNLKIVIAIDDTSLGKVFKGTQDEKVIDRTVRSTQDMVKFSSPALLSSDKLNNQEMDKDLAVKDTLSLPLFGPGSSFGWMKISARVSGRFFKNNLISLTHRIGKPLLDQAANGSPKQTEVADTAHPCSIYIRWLLEKVCPKDPENYHVDVRTMDTNLTLSTTAVDSQSISAILDEHLGECAEQSETFEITLAFPTTLYYSKDGNFHATTTDDLLLRRSRNVVPEPQYSIEDSLKRRQEVRQKLKHIWWDKWIVQALPLMVPYRKWKFAHQFMNYGDVVLVCIILKASKCIYRLAKLTEVHQDAFGAVPVKKQQEDEDEPNTSDSDTAALGQSLAVSDIDTVVEQEHEVTAR